MSNANVELVQSLYAAFGRGDVATVVAACTPDVAWHAGGRQSDFPTFGPRQGRKAVEEFFKTAAETEDFQEFSPREFKAEKSEEAWFCACKRTGKQPMCDGSHKKLT